MVHRGHGEIYRETQAPEKSMGTEPLSMAQNPTTVLQPTKVKRTFLQGLAAGGWMGEPVMERKPSPVPRDTLHTTEFQQEERDTANSH